MIDKKAKKWYNKKDGNLFSILFTHSKYNGHTIPQSAVWLTAPFTQGSLHIVSLRNEIVGAQMNFESLLCAKGGGKA